jgi:hypothetical protein
MKQSIPAFIAIYTQAKLTCRTCKDQRATIWLTQDSPTVYREFLNGPFCKDCASRLYPSIWETYCGSIVKKKMLSKED